MKANELRIGNLFYPIDRSQEVHIPFERPFKVLTIGFEVEAIPYDKVPAQIEKWNKFKLSDLSPIPLTEEWLLKLGFDLQYKSEMHSTYELMNGKFTYYFWYNDKRHYLCFCGTNVVCNYVHTLQNIVHALTGEELTIKE